MQLEGEHQNTSYKGGVRGVGLLSTSLGQNVMAGVCVHCVEILGFIKAGVS